MALLPRFELDSVLIAFLENPHYFAKIVTIFLTPMERVKVLSIRSKRTSKN